MTQDPIRVLLVEDEPIDAELIRRALAEAGPRRYSVVHVETLASACEQMAAGAVDAVLLDLNLPDAHGSEAVRTALSAAPTVPIVVLTGSSDAALAAMILREGAQDYLVKGQPNNVIQRAILYAIERKRFDLERRRIEDRLRDVQKLESLGLLAGGLAHDFNNLLTGILGNASLCLLKVPKGSRLEESLQQIERSAIRASELCKQLLAYSGKGRFVVGHLHLSALVAEMVDMLRLSISKNAMLRCDLAESLPAIEAASPQVRQVVMNLITNASDALEGGPGTISIQTGTRYCDEYFFDSTYMKEPLPVGQYVYVKVSDTGCGMDQETLKQLFDPFFTTKSRGHGLGLAAVLGIARAHGAAIKIYSEPGRGSSLSVLFPVKDRTQAPPSYRVEAGRKSEGTALVIDDEPTVLSVAKAVLSEVGFRVVLAEDGLAGLTEMRRFKDEIVVVLLDMAMPRMSGEEAFHEIRRIRPDVPIILSSGYDEQDNIATFAGSASFLEKPYTALELMNAVQDSIDQAKARAEIVSGERDSFDRSGANDA